MIVGHFGLAAAVKARETKVPLWSLMLATVWLDVVFVPLFVAGVEKIEPVPGTDGGYAEGIIHADYTHSLVGALVLSVLLGAIGLRWWGRRGAAVVAAVSFSHWVLDLFVHRTDLPLLPGNAGDLPLLGFGLWRWPLLTVAIELGLLALGAWLYWRAARKLDGRPKPTSVVAVMVAGAAAVLLMEAFVPV